MRHVALNQGRQALVEGNERRGAYRYNEALDVARVTVPVQKSDTVLENFSIQFTKKDAQNLILNMGWDSTRIAVPIAL